MHFYIFALLFFALQVHARELTKAEKHEMECRVHAIAAKTFFESKKAGAEIPYWLSRYGFVYRRCTLDWWELKNQPITDIDYEIVSHHFPK